MSSEGLTHRQNPQHGASRGRVDLVCIVLLFHSFLAISDGLIYPDPCTALKMNLSLTKRRKCDRPQCLKQ